MQNRYDHKKIEKKWQDKWEEEKLYKTPDTIKGKNNFYTLVEFVYPSGNLHIGHWYALAVPDIFARFKRMQGYNVLSPMGFASFGLPAENAAIKRNLDPKKWTEENITYMRKQFQSMGSSFDWSREVITSDPSYYKWTQWIFIKMFEKGLAYKAEAKVNWCPSCKTVLANEQIVSGLCERCDSEVEIRIQEQWMLKITDYAEKLLEGLDNLDWPEQIKEQQRNWIGKSTGAELEFKLDKQNKKIKVFTTRPDTLFGVTYLVLAPESKILVELKKDISNWGEVEKYVKKSLKKTELERQTEQKEKSGIKIKGVSAVNPVTGEEIPVFVADYVLGSYGTGAVMAVPAHDQRDFEFATKFGLPIKQVVVPVVVDETNPPQEGKKWSPRRVIQAVIKHPTEDKIIQIQWKKQPWKTLVIGGAEEGESYEDAVRREITEETGYKNFKKIEPLGWQIIANFYAAHKDVNREAHTQVFYVELEDLGRDELSAEEQELHEVVWVPYADIKKTYGPCAELPHIVESLEKGLHAYVGEGVLINSGEFDGVDSFEAGEKITKKFGEKKTQFKLRDWSVGRQRYWGTPIPIVFDPDGNPKPVPEENLPWTLPEDVDFKPTGEAPLAKSSELKNRTEKIFGKGWTPEVETMDTFVDSSWYFLRYLDSQNDTEFSSKEKQKIWMPINQYFGGSEHTTLHLLYSRFFQKVLFDLGAVTESEPYQNRLNRGLIMGPDGSKMSKSRGNVIDPDEVVERVGSDTVRMYLAFIGPYNEPGSYPWDMGGIAGIRRFLEKIISVSENVHTATDTDMQVETLLQKTIKKVSDDIGKFKFNTAISSMMTLLNSVEKRSFNKEQFKTLLRLLAPFAPHLAEELWESLGEKTSVHLSNWPGHDIKLIVDEVVTVAVQVNGKIRGTIEVPADISDDVLSKKVVELESVKKWTGDNYKIVKIVPKKLVSIITV